MSDFTVGFPISVQANEDYAPEDGCALIDDGTLVPIDLTGAVLALQVRRAAGVAGAAIFDLQLVTDPAVTGIYMPAPATGVFYPRITKADLAAKYAANGGAQNVLRLAYDFMVTRVGARTAYTRGAFILEPGVTA